MMVDNVKKVILKVFMNERLEEPIRLVDNLEVVCPTETKLPVIEFVNILSTEVMIKGKPNSFFKKQYRYIDLLGNVNIIEVDFKDDEKGMLSATVRVSNCDLESLLKELIILINGELYELAEKLISTPGYIEFSFENITINPMSIDVMSEFYKLID